jgi:hypothetical protein
MLNRLSGFLLGGGYLATVWYAMDQGFIRRKGIAFEEYAMIAGLMGVGWLVLTVVAGLAARKLGNTERGWGNFNGLSLGVLVILVFLPLHLIYGPRHQTGTPFALDEVTNFAVFALTWFVMIDLFRMGLRRLSRADRGFRISAAGIASITLVIMVGFLARAIIESQGAPIGESIETPAKAMTAALGTALAIGFVLMVLLELPRALWLRRTPTVTEAAEPEPVRNTARGNRRVAMPTSTVGVRKEVADKSRAAPTAATTVIRN